ncbi:hypothetical protein K437DRAFT_236630 [Tilletiaria anomala UBC 951]|uniref:Uncharacterized protein n=1 Tax=Tilletiaria anomala (strain ATCC 24038 / CBS 436.72 / UBC 951) TaxID=1037660 RepID=A0A066VVE4_TILAU|nr:uncharacterized protein K437DRAFT_236630 [Tilletiaria anomala UBC 951]KDN44253.1 hypothetical protein K437DRAFT_236630 [Tilletiaria anomala UBC 951]
MIAHILAPIASLNTYLLTTQLHPTLIPFPLLPCLHAARVSLAFRGIVAGARKRYSLANGGKEAPKMGLLQDLGGFLIMAWGGSFIVYYLVHATPPQLLSIYPLLNYLGVHLLIGCLLTMIKAPSAAMLDTALPLLDGATRAHSIVVGLSLPSLVTKSSAVSNPAAAFALTESWTFALLLGTISASGGGQLAGMLGVFNPDGWALSVPPFLRARTLIDCVDIWAPLLGAIAHQTFTLAHPVYVPVMQFLNAGKAQPMLSPTGAKALTTLVVAIAFAWRATMLHWTGDSTSSVSKAPAAAFKSKVRVPGQTGKGANERTDACHHVRSALT